VCERTDDDDDNKPVWPTRAVGVLSGVRDVETFNRGRTERSRFIVNDGGNKPVWPTLRGVGILSGVRDVETYNSGRPPWRCDCAEPSRSVERVEYHVRVEPIVEMEIYEWNTCINTTYEENLMKQN
jgi:hypothetical protein